MTILDNGQTCGKEDWSNWKSGIHTFNTYEKLALERVNYLLIESIIDVGNSMIDGFIMRDPGSYEDIIDILVDEKVMERRIKPYKQ